MRDGGLHNTQISPQRTFFEAPTIIPLCALSEKNSIIRPTYALKIWQRISYLINSVIIVRRNSWALSSRERTRIERATLPSKSIANKNRRNKNSYKLTGSNGGSIDEMDKEGALTQEIEHSPSRISIGRWPHYDFLSCRSPNFAIFPNRAALSDCGRN